jgi:hypothetical protein
MVKFYTKRGKLTVYAFRCGYVEEKGSLNLYMEHGVYHVRGFSNGARIMGDFDTLTEARKCLANPHTFKVSRSGSLTISIPLSGMM